jgi:hypothetical protein
MFEDVVLDFFVTPGDANHDRNVNNSDFGILAGNFGHSPRNFTQGDFNYDTLVNSSDYNILASKFGMTLSAPPAGPGIITVSILSQGEAQLNWVDNVTGESGWRVQMSENGTDFQSPIGYPTNQTAASFAGLEDGKRYWFRVRAYSDAATNPGGPNTAYTPKRGGTTLLPAPVSLAVQLNGSSGALLSWSHAATNAQRAVIQRSTNGFEWTTLDDDQPANVLGYTDSGLLGGQRYYYRVYLENDYMTSAPSYVELLDVP